MAKYQTTAPQLKAQLRTNLRELQGMVAMSHSRQLSEKEMADIAKKQIVVEDLVKELKGRKIDTSKMLGKKYDVGGVIQAYSTPQMAGNLTGGSWGATLYELGGVVQSYTSPALLQFSKGGKISNQYQGKTAEEIWNMLSKEQRSHFLYDHADQIESYRGEEYGEFRGREIVKAYNSDWSELDKHIKNRFENHVREGQYGGGGKIGFKGLARKVAGRYKGKKVMKKYQDEYGKTYDSEEAMEVGRKVAAKVYRQQQAKMADGGMPKVKIENKNERFDENKYKGILDDFDMDGLPNADDPHPTEAGDQKTVEQVEFSKVFNKILDTKQDLNKELDTFVGKLKNSAPSNSVIYARTKTPYSILNKLVSSRLLDEKRGLKDLVGTTIAFDDVRDLQKYAAKVRKGMYGKVLDFDDYYTNPNDGYRAYHFIVEQNGLPIELQLKTKRMKDVNVLSHDAYKKKMLNKDYMLYLTSLADQADRGNSEAQQEFSRIMKNKALVEQKLKNN